MRLFSFFKRKKTMHADSDFSTYTKNVVAEFKDNDFLGKAAETGHKAKDAVNAKEYDKAWGLFQEQKSYYMQHANRSGFTVTQALSLDATVHEEMANILRLEGKHNDALTNIVYWVLAGAGRPIKRHKQKLQAYFNRSKLQQTTLKEAEEEISSQKALPEYSLARSIVSKWVALG